MTVMDDFKVELWVQISPNVAVREDIQISTGGHIGWAIRKNNPELEASLLEFLPQIRRRSLLGNMITDPTSARPNGSGTPWTTSQDRNSRASCCSSKS